MFFKKHVINRKRKKALDEFRKKAVRALHDLIRGTEDRSTQDLYRVMGQNIRETPIVFYPRRSIREAIFRARGRIFGSVTKGEHVHQIQIIQKGPQRFLVKSHYINLPSEHIFDGDRLSIDGVFTLAHEYGHFEKAAISEFASKNRMSEEQAEELIADILSAKLCTKMGYDKEHVLSHFAGRGIVYGRVPFEKYILKAVGK